MKRILQPMKFPETEPAEVVGAMPSCIVVDPATLYVDETYQRTLSQRSVALIRKIVANWDWTRLKPPIVVEVDEGYEVVDGQHTAIAALSHGGIPLLPVMIVDAASVVDRAKAFVGHNRDRLNLTACQLHYAAIAAEDEEAVTVDQVCEQAGVTILRDPPGREWRSGETMAVGAVYVAVRRHHAMGARVILQALAEAHCAPITRTHILAASSLLYDAEYRGQISAADMTSALMLMGAEAEKEAAIFAAAHSVPLWRGLAVVVFKQARRGRRRAA